MHKYIVAHQKLEWKIPFEHKLVTVGPYREPGAIYSGDYLSEDINLNRTFAIYRAIPAILKDMENLPDDDYVTMLGYRAYFGRHLSSDYTHSFLDNFTNSESPDKQYRNIMSPEELQNDWQSKVLLDMPVGYDLLTCKPLGIGANIMSQYAISHTHLDDLLFGLAHAVRAGIISSQIAGLVASTSTIHVAIFAKPSFWRQWLKIGEGIFSEAEQLSSELAILLNGDSQYGIGRAPSKVFVIERIASYLLVTQKHQVAVFDPSKTFYDFCPPAFSLVLDALKIAYVSTGRDEFLNHFHVFRDSLLQSNKTQVAQ